MKGILRNLLKSTGYEVCRLSELERTHASSMGWDLGRMDYKDYQVARTIGSGGHITIDEAKFLASLVAETNQDDPIIEIGTLFGFSTTVLTLSKKPQQKLITVDKFFWNPHGISAYAHKAGTLYALGDAQRNHNVEVVEQDKDEFYRSYDGPAPGLFFCDADHDYEPTLRDLEWARNAGAKIICGHDYDEQKCPGVVKAVQDLGGPSRRVGSLFVL